MMKTVSFEWHTSCCDISRRPFRFKPPSFRSIFKDGWMPEQSKSTDQDSSRVDSDAISNKLLEDGHIEQTCQYYQNAVALNPEDPEAHRNLAVALRQKGDVESAVKHIERALHLQKELAQHSFKQSRIFYFCPDLFVKSGGVRRLYRHVDILVRNGFPAEILHAKVGFVLSDQPRVPVSYLETPGVLRKNDIVVIPEGGPQVMLVLKGLPIRRFVIALSWSYIFSNLPDNVDWRNFNIERVMVVCPVIGDLISWSMGLPIHLLDFAINPDFYYYRPQDKRNKIVYIQHKAKDIDAFRRLLAARNPDYVNKFEWTALTGLSETEYAAQVREASIFLNLSTAEGLVTGCLEAMLAGCVVAGYNSIGGQDVLIGDGNRQNCVMAQNGDYVSLAYRIEPLLKDLLNNNRHSWESIIQNGISTVAHHTPAVEEKSVVDFWNHFYRDHSYAQNYHYISKR